MKYEDIDYCEINEAFAAQGIGVGRKIKEEEDIALNIGSFEQDGNINTNGSGIGLGHPVGCTGLRIITAKYYLRNVVPNVWAVAEIVIDGDTSALDVPVDVFEY